MELFEFFAYCDLDPSWVEAKGIFEAVLCHREVCDGGPLLFVVEVVVGDGQEGYFVDGFLISKVHPLCTAAYLQARAGWRCFCVGRVLGLGHLESLGKNGS